MLYDSYHAKISKIVLFLRKIFKHIVLISVVIGVLLAALIGFMITKGKILDDNVTADRFEMTYGDNIPLKASAMFAKVSYEYSVDGVSWSSEMPLKPGEYQVRAASKSIFGQSRYGKVYAFKLLPREVEITVTSSQIVYGEMPGVAADLSYNDKIVCDNFLYADRFAKTTEITPDLNAVKILTADDVDITDSYLLKAKTTNIDVNPRPILVTVSDQDMIYNDTKFSYDGYELTSGSLASGDVLQAVFNKYLIDVGVVENTPELRIVTSDGFDISMQYIISTEIGTLTVDYRPLIIQTPNAEKVYDDIELFNDKYEITGEYDIVDGHFAECVSKTTITDVDETENILVLEIKNAAGEDKTENYSLFYETGMLKVTPRPVYISTEDGTWVYDGTEHYTDIKLEGFVPGHKINASWPSIIDAGSMPNEVIIDGVTNADGKDVQENYEFNYTYTGTLTVTKRPITIAYESSLTGNIYDGTEKSFENYQITSGSFAECDTLQAAFPSFSQAGTYDNKPIDPMIYSLRTIVGSAGEELYEEKVFAFSDNYEVTENIGTVVIDKREITIKPSEIAAEYDGSDPQANNYDIVDGSLPDGHFLEVKYLPVIRTGVGEHEAEIDLENTFVQFMGKNVTQNFIINAEKGKIVITPRPIELTANSAIKPYDGTPLTDNGFTITSGELVSGHTITLTNSGSQTNIGTSENVIVRGSIVIIDELGKNVTSNYDISRKSGTLEVRIRNLSVTANSETRVYNGTPLQGTEVAVDEISDNNDGLIDGHRIVCNFTGAITNVGTVDNVIESVEIYDSNNRRVTRYYSITTNNGTLSVIPIIVDIQTNSANRPYNGYSLIDTDYNITYSAPVPSKDKVTCIVLGTITNAGTVDNDVDFSIIDVDSGENMIELGNYSVSIKLGKLVVTPIKVNVKTNTATRPYNGTPLVDNYYNITYSSSVPSKDNVTCEVIGTITNAGTVKNDVKLSIIEAVSGEDMIQLGNYEVSKDLGELTVTPIKIIVETHSAEKFYDGMPLAKSDYYVTNINDVLLSKDMVTGISMDATRTNVGTTYNNVSIGIIDSITEEDMVKLGNYVIDVDNSKIGTLTIKPRTIKITPTPSVISKVYDGTPLTCDQYLDNSGNGDGEGFANDEYIIELVFDSVTDVKKSPHKIGLKSVLVSGNGRKNYQFVIEERYLIITPRYISVISGTAEKPYDGMPLIYKEIFVLDNSENDLVIDHKFYTENVIGQRIQIGTSKNTIDGSVIVLDQSGVDVTSNYNITQFEGTLTVVESAGGDSGEGGGSGGGGGSGEGSGSVEKERLEVYLNYISKTYNGKPLAYSGTDYYEVMTTLPEGYIVNLKVNFTDINTHTLTVADINNNLSAAQQDSYIVPYVEFQVLNGDLDISGNYDLVIVPFEGGSDSDIVAQIKPKKVTIESASEERVYIEGASFTNNTAFIRKGSLVSGHTYDVTITGEIDELGTVENTLESVRIFDEVGNDVTSNYDITIQHGKLSYVEEI